MYCALLHDAELKMRDTGALNHLHLFKFNQPAPKVVEQADTVAEQDGHQMNPYLVQQSRSDVLLSHVRAAHHIDVLLTGHRFRLFESAFDAIGHEGEGRCSPFMSSMKKPIVASSSGRGWCERATALFVTPKSVYFWGASEGPS